MQTWASGAWMQRRIRAGAISTGRLVSDVCSAPVHTGGHSLGAVTYGPTPPAESLSIGTVRDGS